MQHYAASLLYRDFWITWWSQIIDFKVLILYNFTMLYRSVKNLLHLQRLLSIWGVKLNMSRKLVAFRRSGTLAVTRWCCNADLAAPGITRKARLNVAQVTNVSSVSSIQLLVIFQITYLLIYIQTVRNACGFDSYDCFACVRDTANAQLLWWHSFLYLEKEENKKKRRKTRI